MKNLAVIFFDEGLDLKGHFFKNVFIPVFLQEKISRIREIDGVIFSVSDTDSEELFKHHPELKEPSFVRESIIDAIDNWKKIFDAYGCENIIRVFSDSFFIEESVIKEMIEIHERYVAEYTYSENLPSGLGCDVFSNELIRSIPLSEEKRMPLEKVIRSNINQFDVEMFYKEPDLRGFRIGFRTSDSRDHLIMLNMFNRNSAVPLYQEIPAIVKENPEVLYIGPSYYEIEITGRSETTDIFSYREMLKKEHCDIDMEVFRKIIAGADEIGLPYSVCLGGAGDPLLHPDFYGILGICRGSNLVKNIVIETDGVSADNNFSVYLSENRDKRIRIIVNINGHDTQTYMAIHGKDLFDRVASNVISLKNALDGFPESLYVQIMKIKETENYLDKYYDFWESKKIPIILQKQNVFFGKIPDRRYSDLSPLERTPCWHLQRDLYFLSDGSAVFCKQDVDGEFLSLNVKDRTVREIWELKKQNFIDEFRGKFSKFPDCEKCDEWYTFNL